VSFLTVIIELVGVAAVVGFTLAAIVTQDLLWEVAGGAVGAGAMLIFLCKLKSEEGSGPKG